MNAPRSIRWKLWGGAVLLVTIPLLFLNQKNIKGFDQFSSKTLQEHMHNYASVVADQYLLHLAAAPDAKPMLETALHRQVSRLAEKTDARIRIYDPEGELLIDSAPQTPLPVALVSPPPEVVQALSGGWSARSRLKPDRSRYYYFLAQPIKDDQKQVRGVAYIIMHTGAITAAILDIVHRQRMTLLITIGVATVVSLLLGWAVTHRLRKLTRAVREHARSGTRLEPAVKGRDEIGELAEALRGMARELDERYIYNHDFVRTLFHELTTPVHAIQGALDLIEDTRGAEITAQQRSELLQCVHHEADRIEKIVKELQQQARFDADRVLGGKRDVDIRSVIEGTVTRWCAAHRRHAPIRIQTTLEQGSINIVPYRIEQVLVNLLDNAARHTPHSGTITLRSLPLRAGWIRVEVEDTGCGIPESAIDRVFDRFYTGEHGKQSGNSGLGLDVAKLLVQQHGGRIGVDSVEGEGCRFYFDLPNAPNGAGNAVVHFSGATGKQERATRTER